MFTLSFLTAHAKQPAFLPFPFPFCSHPFMHRPSPSSLLTCPVTTDHFYAYLFITSLPIKDTPFKVQRERYTANIQTSRGCICIKPDIITGVNTCLIGDTSLNFGKFQFSCGTLKEQCYKLKIHLKWLGVQSVQRYINSIYCTVNIGA